MSKKTDNPAAAEPTADETINQQFDESVPAAAAPPKLRKKRRITLEVTNLQKLGGVIALCQSELYQKELPSKFSPNGKALAWCVDIMNCQTGEEHMLVCNAILTSALMRASQGGPGDSLFESGIAGAVQVVHHKALVGRYFAMRCGELEAGKRYRRVDVVELERAE